MCGIAGILRVHEPGADVPPHHEVIPEAWLDTLDESIKHRGPDGAGRFRDRMTREDGSVVDVALVHRRLSIIDHADGGQPMVHVRYPDGSGELLRPMRWAADTIGGRPEGIGIIDLTGETHKVPERVRTATDVVAVVFNGCIYNHRELRAELEGLGHKFETDHSDTEVLVHGWRAWGREAIWELDAMCGSAWWDRNQSRVYHHRGRYGEKPLYKTWDDEGNDLSESYVLCSTVPGLAGLRFQRGCRWPLEPTGTHEWLALGWSLIRTPIQWINQTPPQGFGASPLGMKDADSTKMTIASKTASPETSKPFVSAEEVDSCLNTAVASRLEADAPLGCFLSGGIDSSLVAHYARTHTGCLQTFTVRMPDPGFDESSFAEKAAEIIDTTHETLDCDAHPSEDLISMIHQLGLPFGDSSLLPTFWVAKAARTYVKVVLTGDGGDEMFCGYERQAIDRKLQVLRQFAIPMRLLAAILPTNFKPQSSFSKALRLMSAAGYRGYEDLVAIFPTPMMRTVAGRSGTLGWGAYSSDLHGRLYDAECYLPGDLMRKSDTATMAIALEARNPFLESTLAGKALATPIHMLMPNGERKGLLKQVARKYLPDEIVDRPKQGFAIPIGAWFRSDFGGMRQLLYDHLESAEPFPGLGQAGVEINMDFVRRMLREHDAAGEKSLNPWHGRDHSQRLYMLLVLSIWAKWLAGLRGGGMSEDLG
jgi:asparagine synthase (glutamine-hydrolysing)